MIISAIAAIGENKELGAKNALLWNIPGELKRFKEITTGHPIIMGRKTYESIGRVLPNRTNIIITRDTLFNVDGAVAVQSLEEALMESSKHRVESSEHKVEKKLTSDYSLLTSEDEIFIIGGGQIFKQALPLVQKLYLTIVHKTFPQADVFFPDYSEFKNVISKQNIQGPEFSYTFLTVER